MNVGGWLLWGFAGTVVLTAVMAGSQGLLLTRMNLPYMLGSIVTPSRDKAELAGVAIHLLDGWLFSLLYVAAFHAADIFTWWFGGTIGVVQAAFVLTVGMKALPGLHPHMAGEHAGPGTMAQLEPPGFLALHYGAATPFSVLLAHLVFGVILGGFYNP